MRFQDWDILLFPHGSSIPVQEFRTSCYGVESEIGRTPNMMSFIPSLPQGHPFQVSIHRWTKPTFSRELEVLDRAGLEAGLAVWGVKVMIDGYVLSSEIFSSDVGWPQVVGPGPEDAKKSEKLLPFPPFHQGILQRTTIDVAEDYGCIKILVSQGFNIISGEKVRFRPIAHVACFSFIHAPLTILESRNIAWPNPTIFGIKTPTQPTKAQSQGHTLSPLVLAPNNFPLSLQAPDSPSNTTIPAYYFTQSFAKEDATPKTSTMPPPPRPGSSFAFPDACPEMYSLSNCSPKFYDTPVSSFQYVPDTSILSRVPLGSMEDVKHVSLRLPSHQIKQVIDALNPGSATAAEKDGVSLAKVAPPTLIEEDKLRKATYGLYEVAAKLPTCPDPTRSSSDISMHADCDQFPQCIVDDPYGEGVIHSPVSDASKDSHDSGAGTNTVKKKPASPMGKKRTRSRLGDTDSSCGAGAPRKLSKSSEGLFRALQEAEKV